MAVKQIGIETGGKMKRYQCTTTDTSDTYPTASDCGAGSTMRIIDETLHKIVAYKEFDGTYWNEL